MQSDRSSRGWALTFAQSYFGWPDEQVATVAGSPGWKHMLALWQEHGEAFYHLPDFVMRQEWFHSRDLPTRQCPNFYEAIPKDGVLFDFGCGTAEQERRLWIEQGRHTVLTDLEGPNFDYLRTKYTGYPVMTLPLNGRLPHGYDAFLCMDVLEHVPEPMPLLEALWDGLKPGGQACLWFDYAYPAAGHLKASIDQIPAYERWLVTHATILHQGLFDWVEKPRRWWRLWT